jgi:hypothetical protein
MLSNGERRQDIGLKLMYVIFTAILTLLLATFFNKTYTIAEEAKNGLSVTNVKVAVLEQCIKGIDLALAKMDIKLDTLLSIK